jgi:heterodisulfide reductase subunit B
MNGEVYQDQINAKYRIKLKMPVVYYSTLMTMAYGRRATDAALEGHVIPATRLEEIAGR